MSDEPLIGCPECGAPQYSLEQDVCLSCGWEPESIADLLPDAVRAEAIKAWGRPLPDPVVNYILTQRQTTNQEGT